MKITVTLDDAIVARAREYAGVKDIGGLLDPGLRRFISVAAAALGGTDPTASAARRGRFEF